MKKVVFITPSLQTGGMQRTLSELAYTFTSNEDIDLHIILYGPNKKISYVIPESVKINTPHFEFDCNRRLLYSLKILFFIRKQVKKINPLSVLSFGEYWNSFVLIALFWTKYPVYVSDRSQPNKSLGAFHDFLRKLLYPKTAGVVAQTYEAKDVFQKLYHHKNIQVIGNPIKTISTYNEIEKENIVLSVGRLIKTKHHDELIKLFARINKSDWRLIIVGDDVNKQQNKNVLTELINTLGMQKTVILTGERTDVDYFYRKSKIFAFTSSSEGFPNVLGEAMSAGLPVISFNCIAGPSEMIVDGQDGFLIPLFDFQKFQEKLFLLMENQELRDRLGNNALNSIKKFSSIKISQKYRKFLIG